MPNNFWPGPETFVRTYDRLVSVLFVECVVYYDLPWQAIY